MWYVLINERRTQQAPVEILNKQKILRKTAQKSSIKNLKNNLYENIMGFFQLYKQNIQVCTNC